MADKESVLALVIRTVDQATAGLRRINERVKGLGAGLAILTAPARLFGERLAALGKEAGVGKLVEAFKGVGSALGDAFGKVKAIGGQLSQVLGVVGLGVGAAAVGLVQLVGDFDDLGDKAERLGVGVDFLASMRYAAERSGASVDELDQGMKTFTQGLGEARANTGPLVEFLSRVSPALLRQVKAAKSNEEAFGLMARAMAKVQDPAKRAALAQKVFGTSALAPLLARGASGIDELRGAYMKLAGSQEGAATTAGGVDDAMKDLKAATDGIKAALVTGLGPALKVIVEQLKTWFMENRERIGEWAANLGKRLPGAIRALVDGFQSALDTIVPFLDAIGGIKTIAIALAAVIMGPVITSIVSLGVALLTTPVGWIMGAIALIAFGVYEIVKHWDGIKEFFVGLWDAVADVFNGKLYFIKALFLYFTPLGLIIKFWEPLKSFFSLLWDGVVIVFDVAWRLIKGFVMNFTPLGLIIKYWEPIGEFFSTLWDGITSAFSTAWDVISSIIDKINGAVRTIENAVSSVIDFLNPFSDDHGPSIDATRTINTETVNAAVGAGRQSEAKVKIELGNAPRGTRVNADPQNTADVDLSVGYQMGFGS